MFKWLVILFVGIPCIELVLLTTLGAAIGFPATVGIILFTGVAGAWLARRQGSSAWRRIQNALNQGRMPTDEIVDGFLVFTAGLLLVTPGFLTDAVGFLLLVPPVRDRFKRLVVAGLKRHFHDRVVVMHGDGGPEIHGDRGGRDDSAIDVTAETIEDTDEN